MKKSNIEIAEKIAEAWNAAGIQYGVAHGLEDYPNAIGRDLDILVPSRQVQSAKMTASDILSNLGYLAVDPPNIWGERLLATDGLSWNFLEIHTLQHLAWKNVLFADQIGSVQLRGIFKIDPWVAFVKRVLIPALAGDIERFGQRHGQFVFYEGEEALVRQMLSRYAGHKQANQVCDAVNQQSLLQLSEMLSSLRKSLLVRYTFRHPFRTVKLAAMLARRKIMKLFSACGPVVAVVGPDGSGKSSVLSNVLNRDKSVFTRIVLRHWRPGLLPQLGTFIGKNSEPTENRSFVPRRTPGRFRFLRLTYYFLDFFFGYWIKDVSENSYQRLVLYDRCALDMAVDPVRYGLSSARGTRLLWRLIPKPDAVVLLYDDPERIYARKPELPLEEIGRQLDKWLELAAEGEVDAIIRVDAPPEQIAERVKEIVVQAFIEKNRVVTTYKDDMAWFGDAISGKSTNQRETQSHTASKSKRNSAHRFARLSFNDGRGYLLPLNSPQAAVRALDLYPAQRARTRLAKRVLSLGLKLGVAQHVLPRIEFLDTTSGDFVGDIELLTHIQYILSRDDVVFGVSLGIPGPQRKPVIQILNPNGETLAYAKIGWNETTNRLVKNEFHTLEAFRSKTLSAGEFVHPIHFEEWHGKTVLLTLPSQMSPASRTFSELHEQFLVEVAQSDIQYVDFSNSPFFASLKERLDTIKSGLPTYQTNILDTAIDLLSSSLAGVELPWVWRLGDFTPWNIFLDAQRRRLHIMDVEYAAPQCIPGWDIFNYFAQTTRNYREQNRALYHTNRGLIEAYFRSLQIETDYILSLRLAYAVDLWIMWNEVWEFSGNTRSVEAYKILRKKVLELVLSMNELKQESQRRGFIE